MYGRRESSRAGLKARESEMIEVADERGVEVVSLRAIHNLGRQIAECRAFCGEQGFAQGNESLPQLVSGAESALREAVRLLQRYKAFLGLDAQQGGGVYFWSWQPIGNSLEIGNDPVLLAAGGRRRRFPGWAPLIDDAGARVIDEALGALDGGRDETSASLRVRNAAGGWHMVQWRARVIERDEAGRAAVILGGLRPIVESADDAAGGGLSDAMQRLTRAEQALREKNLFLANLSHEIRTPINAIMGLATLTGSTHLTAEQAEYIRLVRTSAESVVSVLTDVLDFSRIEAGSLELDPVDFSPRRLASDTVRALAFVAQAKGLEVILNVSPDVPAMLRGDAMRIKQIITNLLQNAIKFTSRGEIELNVQGGGSLGGHCELRIAVRDTGCGVPEEVRERIFRPFAQADARVAGQYGGSGLGLSISRRLAELMGGGLDLASEPGLGSTFTARLDCQVLESPALPGRCSGLSDHRVVFATRNEAQGRALLGMAESLSASAQRVGDCRALADFVESPDQRLLPGDWVVVDIDLLGHAEASHLGDMLRARALRSLLLVGVEHDTRHVDAMRAQFDGILLKPGSVEDFQEAVETVFGAHDFLAPPDADLNPLEPSSSARPKVLVAEDNHVSRQVTAALLTKAGYEVEAVVDGQAAMDLLEEKRFAVDLVLLDLQMPRMDGIATSEAIRMHEMRRSWVLESGWRQLPILGLTGDVSSETEQRCLGAGMTKVLRKPVRPEKLLEEIQQQIALGKSEDHAILVGEVGGLVAARVGYGDTVRHPVAQVVAGASAGGLSMARLSAMDQSALRLKSDAFFQLLAKVSGPLQQSLRLNDYAAMPEMLQPLREQLADLGASEAISALDGLLQTARGAAESDGRSAYETLMKALNTLAGRLRSMVG